MAGRHGSQCVEAIISKTFLVRIDSSERGLRSVLKCSFACADFCFFCEYSSSEAPAGVDYCAELRAIVTALAAQKKELPVVVDAVHRAYNNGPRALVSWESRTGETVSAPEWTREAITRHLLYSTEFR